MKELSPQAQAILEAVLKDAYGCTIEEIPNVADRVRPTIAASLRAAVTECAMKRHVHPDSLITEFLIDADDILGIAAELEAP